MKTKLTRDELLQYLENNEETLIGTTQISDNCIGDAGVWVYFSQPDRKHFIKIDGQKNRDDFRKLVYQRLEQYYDFKMSERLMYPLTKDDCYKTK